MSLKLQIHKKYHGDLIGSRGATIRELQHSFHVDIDIPSRDDPSNCVTVVGAPENLEACQRKIEEILGFSVGTDPLATAELAIQPSFYGAIIGRRGSTLHGLEEQFHAAIDIPGRGEEGNVKVQAPEDQLQACIDAIREIIDVPFEVVSTTSGSVEELQSSMADLNLNAKNINEALFFPDETDDNLQRFLQYLDSAQTSLDICVFTISDDRISSIIKKQHYEGKKVRIITDDECMENIGSDVAQMRDEHGIAVKVDNSPAHMHHKFAVLDGRVLINGSFNWTHGAATDNCENIMITNNPTLISQYQQEFEKLWAKF